MARPATSPEATAGLGTMAEYWLGGRMLAALLLEGPVEGLPGALVPQRVHFQAAAAVDDLVVTADDGAGRTVTWYIASRIRPKIGAGAPNTVALFATYLRVLADNICGAAAGTTLLGLATLAPHTPSAELAALAPVAGAGGPQDRPAAEPGAASC